MVHGGQHEGDIRGEEVVHLVTQRGLAEEAAASHQVPNGHVEVVGSRTPVGDLGEGVHSQDILREEVEVELLCYFDTSHAICSLLHATCS